MWWATVMTVSFGFAFQDRAAWTGFNRLALTSVCSQRSVVGFVSVKSHLQEAYHYWHPASLQREMIVVGNARLIGNRHPYLSHLCLTTGDTKLFCVLKGPRTKNTKDRKQKGSKDTSACPQTWKTSEWPKGHSAKNRICYQTDLSRTDRIRIDNGTLKRYLQKYVCVWVCVSNCAS